VERHQCRVPHTRDLLVRDSIVGRHFWWNHSVVGRKELTHAVLTSRYCTGRVRCGRCNLSGDNLRHPDAQLHRYAVCTHWNFASGYRGHCLDNGANKACYRICIDYHCRCLSGLRVCGSPVTRFSQFAKDQLGTFFFAGVYGRWNPRSYNRGVIHLHHPVHHLCGFSASV